MRMFGERWDGRGFAGGGKRFRVVWLAFGRIANSDGCSFPEVVQS